MSEFRLYTTKDGDRWDLIAYKHYGDVNKMDTIISANPFVPITPTLEAGITIKLPIIEDLKQSTTEDLPPWMQ